jgi:hypothetical protein
MFISNYVIFSVFCFLTNELHLSHNFSNGAEWNDKKFNVVDLPFKMRDLIAKCKTHPLSQGECFEKELYLMSSLVAFSV